MERRAASSLITAFGVALLTFLVAVTFFPLLPDISAATFAYCCRMIGGAFLLGGCVAALMLHPGFHLVSILGLGLTFLPSL